MKNWEIDLLEFCLRQWDILSSYPERYDCITDHCHMEYQQAIEILNRYKETENYQRWSKNINEIIIKNNEM